MKAIRAIFLLGCVALLNPYQAPGQKPKAAPEQPPLGARIEVDEHKHSFTVRFYLKNTGKDEVKVQTGSGGGGMRVVPRFDVAGVMINPPTYHRPPRRSMRPDYRVVPAGKEVLYGTFTMGYPPVDKGGDYKMTASITFRELKATIQSEAKTVKLPAWTRPK